MGFWFYGPWTITSEVIVSPRLDPDQNYAKWFAGDNAFCEQCRQRTPLLYAVTVPGPCHGPSLCRACAERTLMD